MASIFEQIGDFAKGVFDFERQNLRRMGRQAKEDPERLFLGAADPFGSKLWGGVLGKDYEPMVNQMGGATEESYAEAEAKGIDTGPGRLMHSIAESIASMYAAGYGTSKIKAWAKAKGIPEQAVDAAINQAKSAGSQQSGGGGTFEPAPMKSMDPRDKRNKVAVQEQQKTFPSNAPQPAKLKSVGQTFQPAMKRE